MVAERDDRAFLWEYVFTVPQESHFPGQIEPYGLRSPDWTPEDEARWHRGLYASWILIQPTQQDINAGIFHWEQNDREWGQVPDPTDPEHIESPTGRGIMMMRNFMSRVEFNELGNKVVLEKQRSQAAAHEGVIPIP